jgi:hypothetical protein
MRVQTLLVRFEHRMTARIDRGIRQRLRTAACGHGDNVTLLTLRPRKSTFTLPYPFRRLIGFLDVVFDVLCRRLAAVLAGHN